MPNPTAPAAPTTPKRHRSPNYPAIDLQTAIAKTQTFYATQQRNAIPANVATQTLGYSARNSEGKRVLSALVSFGLFEEETTNNVRHVKISPLGLNVLRHDHQPTVRLPFLRESAVNPSIYGEMVTKWPDELPSDLVIAQYLEFDKGFNGMTVKRVIRTFRSTYAFADMAHRSPLVEEEQEKEEETPPDPQQVGQAPPEAQEAIVEPLEEQEATETPPEAQSKSVASLAQREEEKFVIPLLAGGRLVVRYPKGLAESEVQMMDSAFAMIRASIRRR